MFTTQIAFEKAVENVNFYLTKNKNKFKIQNIQTGYTSWANSIKTLEQYRDNAKYTAPSKYNIAVELLNKVKEVYDA